jgi:hypothetical protein
MLVPTLILFYKFNKYGGSIITIALFGIIGLVMRNFNRKIAEVTQKKYATINGFKQQEN